MFQIDAELATIVARRLERRWSPGQISRWLRRRWLRRTGWHVCTETIYDVIYRCLIMPASPLLLRTVRPCRHRRGRGRTKDGALKQSTAMKPISQRLAIVESRRQASHWEGDLIIGAAQRSDRDPGGAQGPLHAPGAPAVRALRHPRSQARCQPRCGAR